MPEPEPRITYADLVALNEIMATHTDVEGYLTVSASAMFEISRAFGLPPELLVADHTNLGADLIAAGQAEVELPKVQLAQLSQLPPLKERRYTKLDLLPSEEGNL